MAEDITDKQNYLKTEILDKGYDTQTFIDYLKSGKEGGDDVNNWTMEELKTVSHLLSNNFQIDCY